MTFSLSSLIFLLTVTVLFFAIREPARPYVLLAASLWFIWQLDARSLAALIVCTALVYAAALLIQAAVDRGRRTLARILTTLSILALAAVLLLFKYAARLIPLLSLSGRAADDFAAAFLLPIGFSYYVFQAIGYLADVCRGKLAAEKNPGSFALYMCFFPKFVSGPIERAEKFLPQIKTLAQVRFFDAARMSSAFTWILYGCFLKVVVADRIAPYTAKLFVGYALQSSPMLFFGAFLYTMQIYCDFAGYSAIAVGLARIYGLELIPNFDAPYLSDNISVFWRRWHRSLSQWLRDYLYIPLGGSRRGALRHALNTVIVFVLCGMWHGNGLNFLVWGLLHGLYSLINLPLRRFQPPAPVRFLMRIATFCAVAFAWIFFGAGSLSAALGYVTRMFTAGNTGASFADGLDILDFAVADKNFLLIAFLLVFVTDVIAWRRSEPFADTVQKLPFGWRYLLFSLLAVAILVLGVYGPGFDARQFMYAAF